RQAGSHDQPDSQPPPAAAYPPCRTRPGGCGARRCGCGTRWSRRRVGARNAVTIRPCVQPAAEERWNGVIVAGFVFLLAAAPFAILAGDARIAAGLAYALAALALWRVAALQERERRRQSRPADVATFVRELSGWLARRRRDPIVSEEAKERGLEYATGVQDGAYAVLDDVLDRLAEILRMLPPGERGHGAPRGARQERPRGGQSHRQPPGHPPR